MPKERPPQLDSPVVAKVIKVASRANTRLYRLTGGLLGSKWRIGSAFPTGIPICLLTTTGKRSGQPRTAPLLHLRDGDRVVLVASQGGLPRHPDWYHNVQAHPQVTVQIKREIRRMTARTATSQERADLWPRLVAMYADFNDYQSWTDREIPVVICDPT